MHYLAAVLIFLAYIIFCVICWLYYRRRTGLLSPDAGDAATATDISGTRFCLITYASQTGNAERIARQTAEQLQQAGVNIKLLALDKVDRGLLIQSEQTLFIVSTYGEGEAPDNGTRFLQRQLTQPNPALSQLRYGILALGDSSYSHFCGFGHALEHALHHQGANPLFDLIEVDKNDESALRHWQYYLGQLSGQAHFSDWNKPQYDHWQLQDRRCLNPASPGNPVFYLRLVPAEGIIHQSLWQAGDIAEIGPCNLPQTVAAFLTRHALSADTLVGDTGFNLEQTLARRQLPDDASFIRRLQKSDIAAVLNALPELPHREYSIASIPQDGALDLLVRQVHQPDGSPGLGSGWLTQYSAVGDSISLRVRANANFHGPDATTPMILIGNGTGIAGLRAHLRARVDMPGSRNWLFFGERTKANDFYFADEILEWLETAKLSNLQLAFSRDPAALEDSAAPRYVQDLLIKNSSDLKSWIEQGAVIYVCGSLQGMAKGVDDALAIILGRELLEILADSGRYRRDVY